MFSKYPEVMKYVEGDLLCWLLNNILSTAELNETQSDHGHFQDTIPVHGWEEIIIIIIISCYPLRDIRRQQNVTIWSYLWPSSSPRSSSSLLWEERRTKKPTGQNILTDSDKKPKYIVLLC